MKIKRAIISVSDKSGLVPLAKALVKFKIEIFSTGGTLVLLKKNKIKARSISELTGYPEILHGRLKTLHPKVHGGLLYLRSDAKQSAEAKEHGIEPIDMVVVNLYPFAETVRKPDVKLNEAIEQIDIGGPTMLRSAAKNSESVTVVCDPSDYQSVIQDLKKQRGAVSNELRRRLAAKVFRHTAAYDGQIAQYLSRSCSGREEIPEVLGALLTRKEVLRYGENPHQKAAIYERASSPSPLGFEQLNGKQLSYNNVLDVEASCDILREFEEPAACVVKHNNPSGIAVFDDLAIAAERAVDADPLSAFGGIVGLNRTCDDRTVKVVLDKLPFFEVIIAPEFTKKALVLLQSRKNLRVVKTSGMNDLEPYDIRFVKSGVLVQETDRPVWQVEGKALRKNLKWVTKAKLQTDEEIDQLVFAWKCAKVVRSNAIVLTQGKQTVGIGGGQMSRVDSVKIACMKAGSRTRGAFLSSDAFFPMADNIEVAYQHGIRAIIQPGGSIRDAEVIEACDRRGIAMAFTGRRHFKH